MLKNASIIAHGHHYALFNRLVSETYPELGRRVLSSGSCFRVRFVQQRRLAYFARGEDVGRPFSGGASSTVATHQRASTSILLHTRASPFRRTHAALHTEACTQAQSQSRSQPHSLNESGNDENNANDTAEVPDSKSKIRHTERSDLSILKEDTYEYMLDELRVAMKHTDPNQARSRSMAWTDGWTGEKPKEKQDRDSDKLGREKRKRRNIEGSRWEEGRKREANIQGKAFDNSQPSSRPRNKIPSFDDDSNPYLKHILPIYYRNSLLRQARMRRNDLQNLSYLEAEAKLGIASELYFNGSFASGNARGGRGKEAERWRRKKVIEHFERETSEKPTWTRRRGKEEESRETRKNRGVGGKDSFAKVWGDLASTLQS
ncbi:hypothetical protein ACEPAI_4622 [Sanghuangporus weigelae]